MDCISFSCTQLLLLLTCNLSNQNPNKLANSKQSLKFDLSLPNHYTVFRDVVLFFLLFSLDIT